MTILDDVRETARVWRKHQLAKHKSRIRFEHWLYMTDRDNPEFDRWIADRLSKGARFKEFTRARKSSAYPDIQGTLEEGDRYYQELKVNTRLYLEADKTLKTLLIQAWPQYTGSERAKLAEAYGGTLNTLYVTVQRWKLFNE